MEIKKQAEKKVDNKYKLKESKNMKGNIMKNNVMKDNIMKSDNRNKKIIEENKDDNINKNNKRNNNLYKIHGLYLIKISLLKNKLLKRSNKNLKKSKVNSMNKNK